MGTATQTPTATVNSLMPSAASVRPGASTSLPPGASATTARLAKLSTLMVAGALTVAAHSAYLHAAEVEPRRAAIPQIKRTETGNPTRWHDPRVNVTLDPSLEDLGPGALDAVRSAFGSWIETDAALPELEFDSARSKQNKPKQDGVNRVMAAPITIPGHEDDLAITVSYIAPSGAILEADVIINTDRTFHAEDEGSCTKRFDLRSVVTHEVGHFFGLGEDTDDAESTMYFKTSQCEMKKRSLSEPDVVTVAGLYQGTPEETEPGVSCAVTAPSSSSRAAAWCLGLIVAVVATSQRRRARRAA